MAFLPAFKDTSDEILMESNNYVYLKKILQIPQQQTKYFARTIVVILVINVNTNLFTSRLPRNKPHDVFELAIETINKTSIMFLKIADVNQLIVFLYSYGILRLVFIQALCDFVAKFFL